MFSDSISNLRAMCENIVFGAEGADWGYLRSRVCGEWVTYACAYARRGGGELDGIGRSMGVFEMRGENVRNILGW